MSARLRAFAALTISGLLAGGTVASALAQDPAAEPTGLAAVCEANAPDEATLADCLVIVHSILERDAPTSTPIPTADFNDGAMGVIGLQSFQDGKWLPQDRATGHFFKTSNKKEAKRARAAASEIADQMSALLTGVTPDACSMPTYAAAWDLVAALRGYTDGAKGAAARVGQRMSDLDEAASDALDCAVLEGQPGALVVQQANEALVALLSKGLLTIDFSDATMGVTPKGERFAGGATVTPDFRTAAGRDFLIAMWEAYQQAQDA